MEQWPTSVLVFVNGKVVLDALDHSLDQRRELGLGSFAIDAQRSLLGKVKPLSARRLLRSRRRMRGLGHLDERKLGDRQIGRIVHGLRTGSHCPIDIRIVGGQLGEDAIAERGEHLS